MLLLSDVHKRKEVSTVTDKEREKAEALYSLYEQPMYRIAFAVLKNPSQAEDAVSEAFVRIIKNISKISKPESERTKHYIVRIIKSTAINCYRQNRRDSERSASMDNSVFEIRDADDGISRYLRRESFANTISELDEVDRRIISLRYEEGLSYRDVARILSMREAAVRKRFERAKKKLRQIREEKNDEEERYAL